ncbi:Bacteriophage Mu Gam like protein [Caulifigura coniformis]|uniref:Bacteriophage Mu Gam like protein n=1 Tax=Caulifigura coniformis TaxID=2527983 RepID=A0A517SEX7_9PLAN|nr:host-nuclease inhibitor Gam family protein [Caulifigura coniformis]QDT54648.1 Bacteriophage Mu Gam like protein [Caulifigura coniformis]
MSLPRPPAKRLAAKPKCRGFADVELALRELAWLDARRSEVHGVLEQTISAATEEAAKCLRINGVGFTDRKLLLEAAIADYAVSHKSQFVTPESKSLKFTHGTVGFHLSQPRVVVDKKHTPTTVIKALGWTADRAVAILRRLGLAGWIRLNAELDVAALKAAVIARRMTPAKLLRYGLEYVPPQDEVRILPTAYCARNKCP